MTSVASYMLTAYVLVANISSHVLKNVYNFEIKPNVLLDLHAPFSDSSTFG